MTRCLFFLFSFLLGSVPTGFLAAKFFRQIDIRKEGSGNIGSTNAFRVLGKGFGSLVLFFDFAKGFVPPWIFSHYFTPPRDLQQAVWIGMAAILGHVFTPFLKFKGGKGVATGAGVLCASYPVIFLIVLSLWLGIFALSRIVSLSSLLAIAAVPILGWSLKIPRLNIVLFILIFLLVLWAHRSNVGRLIRGEEGRLFKVNSKKI